MEDGLFGGPSSHTIDLLPNSRYPHRSYRNRVTKATPQPKPFHLPQILIFELDGIGSSCNTASASVTLALRKR